MTLSPSGALLAGHFVGDGMLVVVIWLWHGHVMLRALSAIAFQRLANTLVEGSLLPSSRVPGCVGEGC